MSTSYGTIERVEQLTPSMVRVVFGGVGLADFVATESTDQYVNALFVPEGAPYEVPFDVDAARLLDPRLRPRGRRLTVRSWDQTARCLVIDVVVHGDDGFAGRWARNAAVGDRLQMTGPSGGYRPDPDADWYLMVGDESAMPAIAASLEVLPERARCVVIGVVDDAAHELSLESPGSLEINWLHRCIAPDPERQLLDAVEALDWLPGAVDVFVHGEASEVRAIRKHLFTERGVSADRASISPYWRRDHTDEVWRAVKRQWLAEQQADLVSP